MVLSKKVYCNGQFINEFGCSGESANVELINLLLDKTKKRYGYKVDITTDNVFHEIRAKLKYEHTLYDGQVNVYVYEYLFTAVDRIIDLH